MAKHTQETVETVETLATVETNAKKVVTMQDGQILDFGKKGQLRKNVEVSEEGIAIKLMAVTGLITDFLFSRSNVLFDTMATRGIIEFLGNSTAGVYSDKEGLHPEDFNIALEQAIAALLSGVIPTRSGKSSDTKGLGDLIRAYTELRATAVDAEGNLRFNEEDRSAAAVKALIVSADVDTNKGRMALPSVKAKIEEYKLERQTAKVAAANAIVDAESSDLF